MMFRIEKKSKGNSKYFAKLKKLKFKLYCR